MTLRQHATTLALETPGRGLLEITPRVADWLASTGMRDGLLVLFLRHTSASLLVQENADPDVRADLDRFFARLGAGRRCALSATATRGRTTCRRTCGRR
jgi:secondary thiamine-phosphate synthase enzyme